MKKSFSIISSVALLALASCADVPAPYEIHNEGGSQTLILSETFASSLGKFTNYTTSGEGKWVNDYSTAKATGYDNASKVTTAGTYYLVSPEVDLTGIDSAYVTYDYIVRYNKGDENQQLLITDTFDVMNPADGWRVLYQNHVEGADWSTFSNAAVNIPEAFKGKKIHLALRYNTNATSGSTWEVKNFKVIRGVADDMLRPLPGPVEGIYFQSFASDFGKCQNFTTSGEGAWIIDYKTAKATGYDNATKKTTAGTYYLVTPEITLKDTTEAYVEYKYILRYNNGDENQQVLISTSWSQDAPADGWTLLNKKHVEGTDWTNFANTQVQIPEEFIGKTVRLAFRYNTNATSGSTWEVQSVGVYEGKAEEPIDSKPISGKGKGTADDPYNVAAITSLCASGNIPADKVYAKGIVSKIKEISTSYGNATYYISDDGTTNGQFYVYRGYSVGGKKFQSESELKVGDVVVVYGQLIDYNGTKEFTQGNQIYSLNATGDDGGSGGSSEVKNVTIAEFNAAAEGSQYYRLTGTVSNLKDGDAYGNFDLTDATGSVYVYGLLDKAGGKKQQFQELAKEKGIVNTCTLTIIGQRGSYNGKIEVVNAYFVAIEGDDTQGGSGGSDVVKGISLAEFDNSGFEKWEDDSTPLQWKSSTSAGNGTLSKSTDAHSGNYSVQVAGTTAANKRLGSTEITLEAGTYNIKFYAKAASGSSASVRPGYVPVTSNGVGSYVYGDYTNDINDAGWVEINHSFTLGSKTTVNLVIMNSKNPGGMLLIDDYTITKE